MLSTQKNGMQQYAKKELFPIVKNNILALGNNFSVHIVAFHCYSFQAQKMQKIVFYKFGIKVQMVANG